MSTIPPPEQPYGHVPAGWLDNPAVRAAERALRLFGEHVPSDIVMTRADAERLLPLWSHFLELSPREVAAVLARFDRPAEPVADEPERPQPSRGGGWLSGSMGGGIHHVLPEATEQTEGGAS